MIKRIELDRGVMANMHCPFCGQLVLGIDLDDADIAAPCPHTLFVANDYAADYLNNELMQMFNVSTPEQLNELDGFENIDTLTDKLDLNNAIKIAQYEGAPGDTGIYVGFQFI